MAVRFHKYRYLLFSFLVIAILLAGFPNGWTAEVAPDSQSPIIDNPQTAVTFQLKNMNLHYHNLALEGLSGKLTASRRDNRIIIAFEHLSLDRLSVFSAAARSGNRLESLSSKGVIVWDRGNNQVETAEVLVQSRQLGPIRISARPTEQQPGLRMELTAKDMSLASLAKVVSSASLPVTVTGRMDLKLDMKWLFEGDVSFAADLVGRDIGFIDPGYIYNGEKLAGKIRLEGARKTGQDILHTQARLDLNQGEVLLGRYYANLSQVPVQIIYRGELDPKTRLAEFKHFDFSLTDILTVRTSGRLSFAGSQPAARTWKLTLPEQPLAPPLDFFLREPFSAEHPLLKTIHWAGRWGGQVTLDGELRSPTLHGRIFLKSTDLDVPAKHWKIDGINADCPIRMSFAGTPSNLPSAVPEEGRIDIRHIDAPWQSIPGVSIPFNTFSDRIASISPIKLALGGGNVVIENFQFSTGRAPLDQGQILVRLHPIDLTPMLESLTGLAVPVTVSSQKLLIELKSDRLVAKGQIDARVFSGKVILDQISGSNLFSLDRTVKLDASWKNIDLEKLTGFTNFGRITGQMKGSVKDLEIGSSGPIAFQLIMESQDTSKIRKRISVTAIDNLSQFGSGQSPFVGSAALLSLFFKDFAYKKIGIKCTLENDYFSVNGLIKEKGVEYLVKRAGISGVNVINGNPNNRISWYDMIQRLKRIQNSDNLTIE